MKKLLLIVLVLLLLIVTVQAVSPQDTIDRAKTAGNNDVATQHTVDKAKIAAGTQESPMGEGIFLIGVGAAIVARKLRKK